MWNTGNHEWLLLAFRSVIRAKSTANILNLFYVKLLLQRLQVIERSIWNWHNTTLKSVSRGHCHSFRTFVVEGGIAPSICEYQYQFVHHCKITMSPLTWVGVQGWRSGESTRLPPMWPGFDSSTRRHMWVEFVGSLLCTERFSPGTPVSPLLKNQHLTWFALIVNFTLQCPQLVLQR